MFTPLYKYGYFGLEISFVIAFIIGLLFGFVLERAGFSSSRKLAGQFYLRDNTVLKVMFTAIVVAMVGMLYLNWAEIFDITRLYLNPTYLWPQFVGGIIMGAGFVIGGYCPGTSLVASAIGKIDAMFYVLGSLLGMLIFGEVYPLFQEFTVSGAMGQVTLSDWLHLRPGLIAFFIILFALGMFWGADLLEKKFAHEEGAS